MRTRLGFSLAVLCLGFAGLVAVSSSPAGSVAGFGDVGEKEFYTDAVQWMVENTITTGTSPTCFSPGDPVTRGQAAAFMWRMEGEPPAAPHSFTDIVAPWQQGPVSWMAATKITTGTTTTTYSPDDTLTRGQLAALLHRLAGEPAASGHPFTDVVRDWQQVPVAWMVATSPVITTGTTPSTFSPDDPVTRGQLATFFHRYKGEPPVAINPNHPALPPCAGQVDGPATSGDMFVGADKSLIQNHDGQIIIIADGITLDCAGHTVTGSGTAAVETGINILKHTGVTVKNCHVRQFNVGIGLDEANANTVTNNSVSNVNSGIFLQTSDNNSITANSVTSAGDWFGYGLFDGSDHNTLTENTASTIGGLGFIVWASNDNTLSDNSALNGIGIGLGANDGAAGNAFTNNTSSGNTGWQIEDQTAGGGTSGTANTWTANTCIGGGSDPSGLC